LSCRASSITSAEAAIKLIIRATYMNNNITIKPVTAVENRQYYQHQQRKNLLLLIWLLLLVRNWYIIETVVADMSAIKMDLILLLPLFMMLLLLMRN
jgi:hypothetical protein